MFSGKFLVNLLLLASSYGIKLENLDASTQRELPEDEPLHFTQLAEKYDLPSEEYDITTEDNYIIKLFRTRGEINETKQVPVLLVPGVLNSADEFLLRGENSTGVTLVKAGYDVWYCNVRGNKYSRNHKNLDPDKDKTKFWNFSFHEFGYYDLAAAIDFVLNKTGQSKIAAIGHSQGTAIFHVLGSTRTEYNDKLNLLIEMAPIAYLHNLRPILSDLVPLWPVLTKTLALKGKQELLPHQGAATEIARFICTLGETFSQLCVQGLFMPIAGNDTEELETEFFKKLLKYFPAGTSRKNLDHYVQVVNRKCFANYDHGTAGNLIKYGRREPPDYDLKKVTMPIAILAGRNDNISTLEDIQLLRAEIPNEVFYKVMDRDEFNHINFVWGKNMNVYLNPLLKTLLSEFAAI